MNEFEDITRIFREFLLCFFTLNSGEFISFLYGRLLLILSVQSCLLNSNVPSYYSGFSNLKYRSLRPNSILFNYSNDLS